MHLLGGSMQKLMERPYQLPITPDAFKQFCADALKECEQIRLAKGKAYAQASDVLRNFKRLVEEHGMAAKVPWLIFLEKHFSALKKWAMDDLKETGEPLEGRFFDMINYLLLGLGLLYEEQQQERLRLPAATVSVRASED